ncbi:putative 50S ribosomal protein L21, mitochondrial [Cocos nucifera]|uniref:Large ribosomal subunit protein bL21m n=1 Tax=Cocos nucifera TaxID=13894 RepID=A0A8K0IUC3_COCNU|nr:putative 50S ribosomal protein L21, mitochondrial [Cocos nucifera]
MEVAGMLILNRVLILGSKTQTIMGRPVLPDAAVHAVVEEHNIFRITTSINTLLQALDAKVILFKKKRRKNYRRTKVHRQELTELRITGIQGIDKSANVATNG